jgi:hypothetical protein
VKHDHNDIYTIVEKLAILEGRITPASVKKGLNPQQKSVPQLPALFKPKTQKILGGNANEKNPMSGYSVGGCEESINEAEVAEDVLEKVKSSFKDFIKKAEEELEDSDIKEKKKGDSDLKSKDKQDRDLLTKEQTEPEDEEEWYDANGRLSPVGCYDAGGHYHAEREADMDAGYDEYKERQWTEESELGSAMSGIIPAQQPAGEPGVSIKESAPVKTVTNECGIWEMHGNERDGFEIRRAGRSLPTKFSSLDEAQMAVEMFAHHRRVTDESQDYIDEA